MIHDSPDLVLIEGQRWKHILPFEHPGALELENAGGKGVGLASMTVNKISVPPGFVIPTSVYLTALEEAGITQTLSSLFVDTNKLERNKIEEKSAAAQTLISKVSMPLEVRDEIRMMFEKMAEPSESKELKLAVRSSATIEDTAGTSFAGEFDTYLDIDSVDRVITHVICCWKSMFSAQALGYTLKVGVNPDQMSMAVVVQKMVRARSSGVMFTLSPLTGDRSLIVIEATWGLGIGLVGGEITPDNFVISKIKKSLVNKTIVNKIHEFRFGEEKVEVPDERRNTPSISDEETLAIAEIGIRLEKYHGYPVDVEWAIEWALLL